MIKDNIKTILNNYNEGDFVKIGGLIKSKRNTKKIIFIILNDGSSHLDLQLIVSKKNDNYNDLEKCGTGTSILAQGILKKSYGEKQDIELFVDKIEIQGKCEKEQYPLQKKEHSFEFLREIAHLRSRTTTFSAIFRIRSILSHEIHQFFKNRGFYWVHTPIITSSDAEGAGQMFKVTNLDIYKENRKIDCKDDFFKKPSYLTVSGQLQCEYLASSMGKVYSFGPVFRAENSNTYRHLSEFWMVEPEMAFYDLEESVKLAEELLRYLFFTTLDQCEKEIKFLEDKYGNTSLSYIDKLTKKIFKHISYKQAINDLQKYNNKFESPIKLGDNLKSDNENFLVEEIYDNPIVITDFPKEIKAFYMRLNRDNQTVASMEIIMPKIGELIGGSQREERYDVLLKKMNDFNINTDDLSWYLDLRKYGTVVHSGFGLGFDRLIQFITGIKNIRDVIPSPRSPKYIDF